MPWTPPRTWSDGEVPPAATFNAHVRDNELFLAAGHGVRAFRSGALSIASATTTTIGLDGEEFDTDVYHDTVTNNSRLIVPAGMGGLYIAAGGILWAAGGTGRRLCTILKNGTTTVARQDTPTTSTSQSQNASGIEIMAAGDYIELQPYQDSGVAIALSTGNQWTWLALILIGF